MSYRNYVIAAYAVFALVLAWDLLAPWLQIRRELRAARLRAARSAGNGPGGDWHRPAAIKPPLSRP